MIKGIGIDITELSRWRKSEICKKVTSLSEKLWCENKAINFAIVWSIKEAVVKAIGTGFCSFINWSDISVTRTKNSYSINLSSKSTKHLNIDESKCIFLVKVSTTDQFVLASVLWIEIDT